MVGWPWFDSFETGVGSWGRAASVTVGARVSVAGGAWVLLGARVLVGGGSVSVGEGEAVGVNAARINNFWPG